jgi:CheY-like chemotaxis protein
VTDRARRVLLVEDDRWIREVLGEALLDEGWEARDAADGHEAIEVLATWRPDVIVLDLMLPGMDGWQFRAAQRAHPALAGIPVVVVSASRRAEETAAELSVAAIVTKPFDLPHLLHAIARAASTDGAV